MFPLINILFWACLINRNNPNITGDCIREHLGDKCIGRALREKGGISTSKAIVVRCNGNSRIVSHGAWLDLHPKITPTFSTIQIIYSHLSDLINSFTFLCSTTDNRKAYGLRSLSSPSPDIFS